MMMMMMHVVAYDNGHDDDYLGTESIHSVCFIPDMTLIFP